MLLTEHSGASDGERRHNASATLWGGTSREWFLLLPSLLMVFGPPVWRAYGSRSLSASAAGRIDVFVLLQLGVYGFAAALIVLQFLKWREQRLLPHQMLFWIVALAAVPAFMFMSAINAPSMVLTVTMATLFAIGLAVAVFTAMCIGVGRLRFEFALEAFFKVNVILVVLVLLTNVLAPSAVNVFSQGQWRVKGNDVADMSLAASMTLIYAAYLYMRTGRVIWPAALALLGSMALVMPDVRIAYAATLAGLLMLLGFSVLIRDDARALVGLRSSLLGPAMLLAPLILVLVAGFYSDELYSTLTRDKPEALSTLSGRTLIWDWVSRNADWFIGHGFVSGFRHDFQHLGVGEFRGLLLQSLNPRRIGSAHSVYYELVYGLGWMAGTLVLAIIAAVLFPSVRALNSADHFQHLMVRVLALVVAVFCFTQSSFLMPPSHNFGVLMFVMALTLGVRWRQWRARS